jgi:hypothetical protein
MAGKTPHFKFRHKSPSLHHFGCIEMDGEVVHKIADPNPFYAALGYTREMAMAGELPEEFIWDTYFRHCTADCNSCYQLHIVEYLAENTFLFKTKYKKQLEDWLSHYSEKKAACANTACQVFNMQHLQNPVSYTE